MPSEVLSVDIHLKEGAMWFYKKDTGFHWSMNSASASQRFILPVFFPHIADVSIYLVLLTISDGLA